MQFGFFTGPTTLFCMTRLFIIEEVLQFSDYQSFLFIAKVVYYFDVSFYDIVINSELLIILGISNFIKYSLSKLQ